MGPKTGPKIRLIFSKFWPKNRRKWWFWETTARHEGVGSGKFWAKMTQFWGKNHKIAIFGGKVRVGTVLSGKNLRFLSDSRAVINSARNRKFRKIYRFFAQIDHCQGIGDFRFWKITKSRKKFFFDLAKNGQIWPGLHNLVNLGPNWPKMGQLGRVPTRTHAWVQRGRGGVPVGPGGRSGPG